eukprot:12509-Heterococcus_DN1.PRE.2
MQCLEDGATSISSRMEAANAACYTAVRSAFRRYFSHLIPTKSADLLRSASSATLQFTVANARGGGVARSAQELSGGQQSLLGLAFVFALSAYHSAPLYLLDEVSVILTTTAATADGTTAIATCQACIHSQSNSLALPMTTSVINYSRHHVLQEYIVPPLKAVDAALDAANTQRVAELIPQVFAGAQALCVSHHSVTQMQAAHRITVAMQNGASTVVA